MRSPVRIAIIGGGPGGLMLARLLQHRSLAVTVFERDADAAERPQGGSLDLHADTGQRAIRLAGLESAFLAAARPEDQGDRLYDPEGQLLFDRDGVGDDRPEIDRSALRQILIESLDPGVLRWGSRVEFVEPSQDGSGRIVVDGAPEPFDLVIGADGAWSRIRPLLTDVFPIYEGATLVELGFEASRHSAVDALVGGGKMFAVGDNRMLIAQRNGHDHIRGYAGLRMSETTSREWGKASPTTLRMRLVEAFADWAPSLTYMVERGDVLGVRPMHALPAGHRWTSRPGLTLLGDAAHLMSPFSGEGVNLALADAADLADAITKGVGWAAIEAYEASIMARAQPASLGATEGLNAALSSAGVAPVLEHYRERAAA